MARTQQFYINGAWVDAQTDRTAPITNPATEAVVGTLALGSVAETDTAVAAARAAFPAFSNLSVQARLDLLGAINDVYMRRMGEVADAISTEMGAPLQRLAAPMQAGSMLGHIGIMMQVLKDFPFNEDQGKTRIRREPIGVIGMITPWNWPINQIGSKIVPALAAGCTMVLKPSELAPLSALVLADILHEAGVPAGVFNLVNGDGPSVGARLAEHPDVDFISFTGSTRAGVQVSIAAAPSIKKVGLELGGKSANILLDDADFERAVAGGMNGMLLNTGQNCNAPSRMLVPRAKLAEVEAIAQKAAEAAVIGDPKADDTTMGPLANAAQFEKVQALIAKGQDEGAKLVCGGTGRPDGTDVGYFVRPTVFSNVTNDMTIAQQEIFGPVLCILPYDTEAEAIAIANDSEYGLSGYVSSANLEKAQNVAAQIRTGMVHVNGASADFTAGFGGYKKSGLGREWGKFGLEECLETKSVFGHNPK